METIHYNQVSHTIKISIYNVCQHWWKVLNILLVCNYLKQMLGIDPEIPVAKLSWNK